MPLASQKVASVRPAAATAAVRSLRRGIAVVKAAPPAPVSPVVSVDSLKSSGVENEPSNFMLQIERKAQELCEETRSQYELLLQRQEAAHERQLQSARSTLQQVLSTSMSLADHQQLVSRNKEEHQRQLEELTKQYSLQMQQLERTQAHKLARKLERCQQRATERLESMQSRCSQLGAAKSRLEAVVVERERELAGVRASLKELEHKLHMSEENIKRACRHVASLRAAVRRAKARRKETETAARKERRVLAREHEALAEKDVAAVELKSRLSSELAALQVQLTHSREALETERESVLTLQTENKELADAANEIRQRLAQLETREPLMEELRAAERAQFERQAAALTAELSAERLRSSGRLARIEELQMQFNALQVAAEKSRVRTEQRERSLGVELQRVARAAQKWKAREQRVREEKRALEAELAASREQQLQVEAFEKQILRRGRSH